MLKRAMILLGLAAFALSTSGAASALHHAIEHAEPEHRCHTSHTSHTSHEQPAPDRDDAPDEPEECDLCLTLGATRHALADIEAPAMIAPAAWTFAAPPLEGIFIPGVSFTTGPPRAPPVAA